MRVRPRASADVRRILSNARPSQGSSSGVPAGAITTEAADPITTEAGSILILE